jgi:hypothetical protein
VDRRATDRDARHACTLNPATNDDAQAAGTAQRRAVDDAMHRCHRCIASIHRIDKDRTRKRCVISMHDNVRRNHRNKTSVHATAEKSGAESVDARASRPSRRDAELILIMVSQGRCAQDAC